MLKILEVIREINDVDELVEKGEILQNDKKYSEAMICFDKSIKIEPKHEYSWECKGLVYASWKKYELAIPCYDKVIDMVPENKFVWKDKGVALQHIGKHDDAEKCFKKYDEL